jgi:uncharacterized repeat protein (TIGR01451 family)
MRKRDTSTRHLRAARRGGRSFLAAAVLVATVSLAGATPPQAQQPVNEADLAVSKSDSPDPVVVGSTLTYSILVRNLGPNPAPGVRLTDKLPNSLEGVTVSTTSGTCSVNGRTVTCNLGQIGVGTGATVPAVTITARPTRPRRITNSASVRSRVRDPRAGNDLASESTQVLPLRVATCAGFPATLLGTGANDRLVGTAGNDVVLARGGADVVHTFRGHDLVCAGPGNDVVKSGVWADRVFGNAGSDRLIGGGGGDRLRGDGGGDRLLGRSGSDRLVGGGGFDVCKGNRGDDSARGCERVRSLGR